MPKLYVIDAKLRDELLQYLASRPYREVAPAIQMLGGLMEFVPADDPAKTKTPERES